MQALSLVSLSVQAVTRLLTQKQLAALEYVRDHPGMKAEDMTLINMAVGRSLWTAGFLHRTITHRWHLTQAGVDALRERKVAQ